MMLTKFADNVICAETGQPVGLKGWYAQGQAYAYLYGELGIRVKLLFIRKDIKIISGSAAALVEAKLPNTSWFRASVAVNVTILGFIKINLGFKFTVGNYCTFATNGSAPVDDNPFDQDYKAIDEITPAVNASNTSLFVRPKINFNLKLGETIQVDDPSGGPSDYYKPMLDYCKIVDANGVEQVTSKVNTIDSASRITLKLKESLTANTTYKVVTMVSFMERKFGSWVPFRANGVLVEEIREVPFTTGVGADTISLENCEKMYPFVNQKYFYKNEVTNGVCILGTGVSYIFNEAPQWKARFFNSQTGAQVDSTLATYVTSENKLTYTIGANLQPATNYRVEIVKSTFVSGSADSIKPALTFKFTTSQFGTFAAKIQSLQTTQTIVSRLSSEVIALENKLNVYEGFEEAELTGNNYTNYKPLVSAASNLLDSYYLYKIKPLIYNTIPLSDGLGIKNFPITYRDVNELGIPPAKAINISSYYLNSLTSYNANFSKIRLPFIYNLPDLYNQDYENLKTQIANFYLQQNAVYNCGPWYDCGYWTGWWIWRHYVPRWCRSCYWTVPPGAGIPSIFAPLFESPFPFIDQGNYKVNFQFKNVDGSLGTMAELNYNNPIE